MTRNNSEPWLANWANRTIINYNHVSSSELENSIEIIGSENNSTLNADVIVPDISDTISIASSNFLSVHSDNSFQSQSEAESTRPETENSTSVILHYNFILHN